MSRITELIERLNKHADFLIKNMGFDPDGMVMSDYKDAIKTIQHLYTWHISRNENMPSADMECLNTECKKILSENLHSLQMERGMTLDEVIKRFNDNAEYAHSNGNLQGCLKFRQLAEWLAELRESKAKTEDSDENKDLR